MIEVAEAALGAPVSLVRLLHNDGPFPGGRLTYLAEAPDVDVGVLRPLDERTAALIRSDANRAPYAEVGGPAATLEWATEQLHAAGVQPTGTVRQVRTWNLAGIWRIDTTAGLTWLKVTPHFLAHESAVLHHIALASGTTAELAPSVPSLIAGEPGRALMWDVAGHDGYDADEATLIDAVDVLLEIQRTVGHGADLELPGAVPHLDEQSFTRRLRALANRVEGELEANERRSLRSLIDSLPERFGAAEPIGETLVHGDFHGGNLRVPPPGAADGRPVILDWGDSYRGSPLFDVYSPESYSMPGTPDIQRHWLDRLSERCGSDAHQAWSMFRPVAACALALVYERFCDNIEASELDYHRDDIVPALRDGLRAIG